MQRGDFGGMARGGVNWVHGILRGISGYFDLFLRESKDIQDFPSRFPLHHNVPTNPSFQHRFQDFVGAIRFHGD
jgi:hypothetical protein